MPRTLEYTAAEDLAVRELYPGATSAAIMAALPGRLFTSIQNRAARLRVSRCFVSWPEEALAVMKQHYRQRGPAYVAELLGRSYSSVGQQARKMRLQYEPPKRDAQELIEERRVRNRASEQVRRAKRLAAGLPGVPARAPRPVAERVAPRPVAVKKDSRTPNLNAQKVAVAASKTAKKLGVLYTSDQIKEMRKRDPKCRICHAHWLGGDQQVRAYLTALKAAA